MSEVRPSGRRNVSSAYMEWAKTKSHARFNLATSGVMNYALAELPVRLEDLELSGESYYGYEPLQRALASKCEVTTDCVVAATGTSLANHLAMAATFEAGEEILIEEPTYELLISTARYLGAEIKRFPRLSEHNFQLDPREIERAITKRTRLIVITNLHNPSSALTDEETLMRVGEIARSAGARVLVDEVYLDAVFEHRERSAFHLGKEFITTNSLTKVYGLSGLRCGWILAEPELARRMWRINDLFGVIPAHAAERLSCIALAHLEEIGARSRQLLETNRPLLNGFLASRAELSCPPLKFGTVAFPHLNVADVDHLCTYLREKYETSVVPGRFFEMPAHFRVGIGGATDALIAGLDRLGAALDEIVG